MENNPKQETKTQPICDELQEKFERRQRWSWAEASIWTDGMLAALENGVKGGKWFSLIDKVYKPSNLDSAWRAVIRNKGAAGVDRVTIDRYKRSEAKYLEELSRRSHGGTQTSKSLGRGEWSSPSSG